MRFHYFYYFLLSKHSCGGPADEDSDLFSKHRNFVNENVDPHFCTRGISATSIYYYFNFGELERLNES
jgi:hypothetical protein